VAGRAYGSDLTTLLKQGTRATLLKIQMAQAQVRLDAKSRRSLLATAV